MTVGTLRSNIAIWCAAGIWVCDRGGWSDVDEGGYDAVTKDSEKVEIKPSGIENEEIKIRSDQVIESDFIIVVVCDNDVVGYYMIESALLNSGDWVEKIDMNRLVNW